MRRSDDLGELFLVTVFFQLSIPVLHAPLTRMDAYGLYSIGDFAGTSIPFTLSLIANLLVAMVAGLMFNVLYRRQYSGPTAEKSVYSPCRMDCASADSLCVRFSLGVLQCRVLDSRLGLVHLVGRCVHDAGDTP